MEENSHVYIALDADILRTLATIYHYVSKRGGGIEFDVRHSSDAHIRKNFNYFSKLIKYAQEDKIRLLVTTSPYHEVKHKPECIAFITEICYVPKPKNILQADEYDFIIEKLAEAYCGMDKPFDPNDPPPLHPTYISADNKYKAANDAYVFAEATVENAVLLTANAKDFMFYKNFPTDPNAKVRKFIDINRRVLKIDSDVSNKQISRPFTIETLAPILKGNPSTYEFVKALDETKEK